MSESKGFYQAATYLGQHPRISQGILKKTACMGIEERELIADLDAILEVYPLLDELPSMDIPDLISKVLMPFIKNEGYAKWQRDVVTDMALKKGDTRKKSGWKKETKAQEEGLE